MTEIVEVYAAANDVEAAVLIDLLGQNGIIARVAGGLLNGHIAELPGAIESAPRIWVNQADAERARALILQHEQQLREQHDHDCSSSGCRVTTWTCPKCEAEVPFEYDICWNCLHNRLSC